MDTENAAMVYHKTGRIQERGIHFEDYIDQTNVPQETVVKFQESPHINVGKLEPQCFYYRVNYVTMLSFS